jgi:hypothetical protein
MKHECYKGAETRKNFETTTSKLFRAPSLDVKSPPRPQPPQPAENIRKILLPNFAD